MLSKLTQLEQQILNSWPHHLCQDNFHCCVGLSGGIDSVVLLMALTRLQQTLPQLSLSAIHINHGISPQAARWQLFCQQLCQDLEIELQVVKLQVVKIAGKGLEMSARLARYQQFAKSQAKLIALAHHQEDQIETLLGQIMRGSDIHNLGGMSLHSTRQGQHFWRPLLEVPKTLIKAYAQSLQLVHVEDESNQDNQYLRNFLRNQIIPQLKSYDQQVATKIIGALSSIQTAARLGDELAAIDLQQCLNGENQLSLAEFADLSCNRQKNLLSYYLLQNHQALPSSRQLTEFIKQLLTARPDRHPMLVLSDQAQLRRSKNQIGIVLIR